MYFSKVYLKPKIWYNIAKVAVAQIWRDLRLGSNAEDRVLDFVKKTAIQGNAASVLAAAKTRYKDEWNIMLEPDKTKKLAEVVRETKPMVCLEMGCYIGCSAMTIGAQLPPGARLITAEKDPRIADVARQMISFAGLDQVITVVNSTAGELIESLHTDHSVDKLDFVFIDHFKRFYYEDLLRLEKKRLLRKGTILMADNAVWPGAPEFLKYVESSDKYKTERFEFDMPVFKEVDAVTLSVYTKDD